MTSDSEHKPDREAARARAGEARAARAAKVKTIRRRVISGAVSLFVAAWLLIAVVLVTGHDPALIKSKSATATLASNTTTTGSSGSTGSTSTTTTTSSATQSSSSPSSVTTRSS